MVLQWTNVGMWLLSLMFILPYRCNGFHSSGFSRKGTVTILPRRVSASIRQPVRAEALRSVDSAIPNVVSGSQKVNHTCGENLLC
jgi:hypothetical protein